MSWIITGTQKVPPSPYLLDTFPSAAAAYSLRQLRTGNTSVVRVRRDNDNAEQDFTAAEVSDGTLAAWVGAGNDGFVRTWYDQSGNGNDAEQATAANQPLLMTSGSLTQVNLKPAFDFDDANDYLSIGAIGVSGGQSRTTFCVVSPDGYGSPGGAYLGTGTRSSDGTVFDHCIEDGSFYLRVSGNASYSDVSNNLTQRLWTVDFSGANVFDAQVWKNSSNLPRTGGSNATIATIDNYEIGRSASQTDILYDGKIQEIIIYGSSQSANRAAIEANINAHYNIF